MSFANCFTNRTFGVEMEFINDTYSREEIASKITSAGVECYAEYYNHETKNWWKIVTDASCGFELVSPPLSGAEAFEQIKIVCRVLEECGSKVDRRCGLHIHHNANDFTLDTFKNLLNLYIRFENVIDSMMPKSRRANNNNYCRSMASFYGMREGAVNMRLEQIKVCTTVKELRRVYGEDRYRKLNMESYVKHGTIEFRQHSGTLEADKIINWIILTQAMVNVSFIKVSVWQYGTVKEIPSIFFNRLHISNPFTDDVYMRQARKFMQMRIKHFKEVAA